MVMKVTSTAAVIVVIAGIAGWSGVRADEAVRSIVAVGALEARVKVVTEKALAATVSLYSNENGSSGSGVVVSEDGVVLTAAHVVNGLEESIAVFPDGSQAKATVLGMDRTRDSALVQLQGRGPWPFVEVGDSDPLKAGDFVVALGHAGGFDPLRTPPVRFGRVLGRNELGYLVTDCTLIGGDSGGPLFDLEGRVVAIHSSIGAELMVNNHRGVSDFRRQWERLRNGEVWGRLSWNPLSNPDRPVLGIEVARETRGGVVVGRVAAGSPAERAGLRRGDLVREVDGAAVRSFRGLLAALAERAPGEVVKVTLERNGRRLERELKLARLEETYED
jgi:serine protease Do